MKGLWIAFVLPLYGQPSHHNLPVVVRGLSERVVIADVNPYPLSPPPPRTEVETHGESFTPTSLLRSIALRCGRAFGVRPLRGRHSRERGKAGGKPVRRRPRVAAGREGPRVVPLAPSRGGAAVRSRGGIRRLRIGFLLPRYGRSKESHLQAVVRALLDRGVVADVIHPTHQAIDLSTVRVEHDLYVLKKTNGFALSIAGALHAQGAAIVNPYPVTVALGDKIITANVLQAAGVPTPTTYVASRADWLAPLLDDGPLIVKPYQGCDGYGLRIVRSVAELAAIPEGKDPILAQRYHAPHGRDRRIYTIGDRLFGIKRVFPRKTEAEKHGEPFTPTPELCEIALRCGRAFGIDLYGVDIIESEGKPYVVDIDSIPGFGGIPDAPSHLAAYLYRAAERAARGDTLLESAASSAARS
jgi:ribosomal protein S6--L-glutamate ligase